MKRQTGFTLVEVIISAVLFAVIAISVYPTYKGNVRQNARHAAESSLATMNKQAASYYKDNGNYTKFVPKSSASTDRYKFVVVSTPDTYRITAIALDDQTKDVCGDLTINNLGQHMHTKVPPYNSSQKCWN